jgi:hypothetical protein
MWEETKISRKYEDHGEDEAICNRILKMIRWRIA